MSQSPFVTSALREAVTGFFGGSVAWLLTCSAAGLVATMAAGAQHIGDFDWMMVFSFIGHLVMAGLGLWGLITICIHVVCLTTLVQGTDRILRVFVIVFINQLTASSIVELTLEPGMPTRLIIVWVAFTIPVIAYLSRSFRRRDQS